LDLSTLINRKFSQKIHANLEENLAVNRITNILKLLKYKRELSRSFPLKDIYFINEIPLNNVKSILIYLYIFKNIDGSRVLELLNPGIPNDYSLNDSEYKLTNQSIFKKMAAISTQSTSLSENFYVITERLMSKVGQKIFKSGSYKLVAGDKWMEQTKNDALSKKIHLIDGHSNDISKCILSIREESKESRSMGIVHLDAAGPNFGTDSILMKRKTYLSIEVWYPSLCRFFAALEDYLEQKVIIAGHYKSNFASLEPLFDNREVAYGRTIELVQESKLVTTRYSTSINFAVFFRKPILFVYSNQLIKDQDSMRHISGMSQLLGANMINVDNFLPEKIKILEVRDQLYKKYFQNYLSSGPVELSNHEIILYEFLGFKSVTPKAEYEMDEKADS
jgi:hypothetical protein